MHHTLTQAQEEFERERKELHEKALEQQKQAEQREEELHSIIKQLKSELAKVEGISCNFYMAPFLFVCKLVCVFCSKKAQYEFYSPCP